MAKKKTTKDAQQTAWRNYEEVAADLLNRFAKDFGLKSVEGKQKIKGQLTTWTIDAKGIADDEGFLIVECRCHTTSPIKQEELGGLAFRITDTGAAGGIIVSPLGLQEGAAKIAAGTNIVEVKLTENSTPKEFVIQFFDKLCLGISAKMTVSVSVSGRYLRTCAKCAKKFEVSGNRLLCTDCDP
jgi:hypothetical protein